MENYILDREFESEMANVTTGYTPPLQGASTKVEAPPPQEPSTSVEDLLKYLKEEETRKGKRPKRPNLYTRLKLKNLLEEIEDRYKRNKLFKVK